MSAVVTRTGVTGRSFREVWLVTLGHTLTHWYPATFYLLLPVIGRELGLSYSQIGLVMSCQYIAGAIANIPGGMLVDTVGKKGLLLAVSLFWIGFPYMLMGFAHSYWLVLVCISLVGIGNNLWHPTAIPALARRFPDRKGFVLSVHGMGGNLGDALAPLVVGALLASFTWQGIVFWNAFSWREIVFWNIVPGVVIAGLILFYLGIQGFASDADAAGPKKSGDSEGQALGEYLRGLKQLFRDRAVALLLVSSTFRTMTQSALLTFLPVYLAYEMGYSPFWVGACMSMLQLAGFAAAPIAGHLSDKMGRRSIIMSSMAMTAVVLVFMAVAGRSHAFILLIAVLGFFLYAVRPVLQAWLLDSTPKKMGGTSIGALFGAQAVGSAIAPVVGGMLADRHGLMATFYFLAGTIVLANLFIFFMPARASETAGAR